MSDWGEKKNLLNQKLFQKEALRPTRTSGILRNKNPVKKEQKVM